MSPLRAPPPPACHSARTANDVADIGPADWAFPANRSAAIPSFNESRRNLIYHIWPVKGSGTWQRNLDQLRMRLPLFNGRRIVGIATDAAADPPEAVREYLRGERVEFLEMPNDSKSREVATFIPMLEKVMSDEANSFTFFAHAKGVKHSVGRHVTVHRWAMLQYETLLDYWPLVEAHLQTAAVVGSFKLLGRCFPKSRGDWHYSGSFYWLRHDALAQRNWREIDQDWFGVEAYPSLHFARSEAACVFHQGHRINMYTASYVNRVEKEYERWRSEKRAFRSAIGSSTASLLTN